MADGGGARGDRLPMYFVGGIAAFLVVVAFGVGLIAMAMYDHGTPAAAAPAPAVTTQVAAPTQPPIEQMAAKPVTVEDISRPAVDVPESADYTKYEDGTYSGYVKRTGPITQEIHFQIQEVVAEVVPGTTMEYWTFDGTVPGPMIRARVGDTLDFYLHNPTDASMPHNVDFHAVTGPGGGGEMLDTLPGAVSELKVKLIEPGIYVYHCAFPDVPTHLSHGMYGLIVVEPEGGLPKVDHEYYVFQSDWYTDRGGSLATTDLEDAGHLSYSIDNARIEEPTFVTFNGRPGALVGDLALGMAPDDTIEAGDTVRLFVGNGGPNLVSSFHVIGEIFDTVYVEGSFSLVNENVQTTLIPSGGAVGVEFTVEVPGAYLLVDHSIFRIHKGAAGILMVEGPDRPDLFDPIKHSEGLRGDSGTGH